MFLNSASILPFSSGPTQPSPRLAITCANYFTSCARHFQLWSNSSLPMHTCCTGTLSRRATSMSLSSNRRSLLQTRRHDGMTSTHSKTLSSKLTTCIEAHYSLAAMMNGSCLSGSVSASATGRPSNTCCVSLKGRATTSLPSAMRVSYLCHHFTTRTGSRT